MSFDVTRTTTRWSAPLPAPLGRSRLLGVLGAALVGLAVRAVSPREAAATHAGTPYYPHCFGYSECDCCSGSTCCHGDCISYTQECPSGGQCWANSDYENCKTYWCCDWYREASGTVCICATVGNYC